MTARRACHNFGASFSITRLKVGDVNDKSCWNCGHSQEHHTIAGGCSFAPDGAERCDCPRYEDSEYYGEQRKRDTYTLSDRRRIGQGRPRR